MLGSLQILQILTLERSVAWDENSRYGFGDAFSVDLNICQMDLFFSLSSRRDSCGSSLLFCVSARDFSITQEYQ